MKSVPINCNAVSSNPTRGDAYSIKLNKVIKFAISTGLSSIEVSVSSQEIKRSYTCVFFILSLSLFLRFFHYILDLFRRCNIVVSFLITYTKIWFFYSTKAPRPSPRDICISTTNIFV